VERDRAGTAQASSERATYARARQQQRSGSTLDRCRAGEQGRVKLGRGLLQGELVVGWADREAPGAERVGHEVARMWRGDGPHGDRGRGPMRVVREREDMEEEGERLFPALSGAEGCIA
jgi:hypothetical protein